MKRVLLIIMMILIVGCNSNVDLTFKESLFENDVKLTNYEKNNIIEFLSEYEFQYLTRDGYYYGGAYYVVEYEIDGIKHHWIVSGSASECCIEEKEDGIYYCTYDSKVINYLSKYAK